MSQFNKAERLLTQHKDRLAGGRPATAGTLRGTMVVGISNRDGFNSLLPGYNESSPHS